MHDQRLATLAMYTLALVLAESALDLTSPASAEAWTEHFIKPYALVGNQWADANFPKAMRRLFRSITAVENKIGGSSTGVIIYASAVEQGKQRVYMSCASHQLQPKRHVPWIAHQEGWQPAQFLGAIEVGTQQLAVRINTRGVTNRHRETSALIRGWEPVAWFPPDLAIVSRSFAEGEAPEPALLSSELPSNNGLTWWIAGFASLDGRMLDDTIWLIPPVSKEEVTIHLSENDHLALGYIAQEEQQNALEWVYREKSERPESLVLIAQAPNVTTITTTPLGQARSLPWGDQFESLDIEFEQWPRLGWSGGPVFEETGVVHGFQYEGLETSGAHSLHDLKAALTLALQRNDVIQTRFRDDMFDLLARIR